MLIFLLSQTLFWTVYSEVHDTLRAASEDSVEGSGRAGLVGTRVGDGENSEEQDRCLGILSGDSRIVELREAVTEVMLGGFDDSVLGVGGETLERFRDSAVVMSGKGNLGTQRMVVGVGEDTGLGLPAVTARRRRRDLVAGLCCAWN